MNISVCVCLLFVWSRCTASVLYEDLLRRAVNNKEVITHNQQFHSTVLGGTEPLDDRRRPASLPLLQIACSSKGRFLHKISGTAATGSK